MVDGTRLVLIKILLERTPDGHVIALWQCQCGKKAKIALSRVKHGKIRSCGCLVKDTCRRLHTTHGMKNSPEYSSWDAMKQRCLNPKDKAFKKYGAKGITVFPPWINSFEAFFEHVGKRPPGKTLERFDTTKSYVPGNVGWATPFEQAINRLSSCYWIIHGNRFPDIESAAHHFNVSTSTIHRWTNGVFDHRDGIFRKPKEGCYAEKKY